MQSLWIWKPPCTKGICGQLSEKVIFSRFSLFYGTDFKNIRLIAKKTLFVGSSSFSIDKMIFNPRPRWFLWGYPHKKRRARLYFKHIINIYIFMPVVGKILWNANFLTIYDIISSHSHTPYLAAFSSVILEALNTIFWKNK